MSSKLRTTLALCGSVFTTLPMKLKGERLALMFHLAGRQLRAACTRILLGASCLSPACWNLEGFTDAGAAPLAFDIWQGEKELEQRPITSVIQSSEGYLWLGSFTGLLRFDGMRVTTFDSSTAGLQNGRITSLYEDPQHVLWIGHETGELTKLSGGEFQAVPLPSGWPGGPVEDISSDERNDLWLLTNLGGLVRVRDGRTV